MKHGRMYVALTAEIAQAHSNSETGIAATEFTFTGENRDPIYYTR